MEQMGSLTLTQPSKKQDSPSNAKASPCGAFASHPADFD
jgi:hypothetical protein